VEVEQQINGNIKMLYHSHLCGCSFSNVSIYTIGVFSRRSNDGIISCSTFLGSDS